MNNTMPPISCRLSPKEHKMTAQTSASFVDADAKSFVQVPRRSKTRGGGTVKGESPSEKTLKGCSLLPRPGTSL